ncbi:unnamed protein product [Eruca vesicaria subsp. sativa]|uniref:GUN4-like domain-containing protein n=1 Tax=Eruca vesicaria subsp. sativa TaxID=29727 RepID=A0ABC8LLN3_ERUVS|nr:unnamed protein product [Eruca vesicaria subsp. sativa]
MATTNSLHHHHSSSSYHRLNLLPQSHVLPSSLSLKHPTATFSPLTSSSSTIISASLTTQTTTDFDLLSTHLTNQDFRKADEETRRLLIQISGDPATKRGYVFFSEVKSISVQDLQTIDDLWTKHSDGRFGYSVQRKIWLKVKKDFTRFFIKVEWMKLLDTEVVQYNYRAFPDEFKWELDDETPVGHLPLTNALRGTQLLKCVLSHPAFEIDGDDVDEEGGEAENRGVGKAKMKDTTVFKTDYSF